MVYVNGLHPIIILEFGEELLSNNSNICVIQSNRRWDPAAIEDLRNQIQLQERVLCLHGTMNDVETRTDDKDAQREPTKNLGDEIRALTVEDIIDWHKKEATKPCDNTCRYWALPFIADNHICGSCIRAWMNDGKGTDNYEPRSDLSNVSEKKHE